jgi:uncharacterized protein (TIRG00374 family)
MIPVNKSTALRLLQMAIALAVAGLVAWQTDQDELWSVLREADPWLMLAALALNLPVLLLAPLRSSLVLRRFGRRVEAAVFVPGTIVGLVAGGMTPGAVGELARVSIMRDRAGVPASETTSLVLFERTASFYILTLGTAAVAAALALPEALGAVLVIAAVALLMLPWLIAVGLLPLLPGEERISGAGIRSRVARGMASMAGRVRNLFGDWRLLLAWSALTLAMFALTTTQYWLLVRSVDADLSLSRVWVAYGVSAVATIVTLLPFGLGVGDGSLAAVLHRLGTTFEQGAAVAVLVRATVTLPLVLVALLFYLALLRRGPSAQVGSPQES